MAKFEQGKNWADGNILHINLFLIKLLVLNETIPDYQMMENMMVGTNT
jgi:hypothetical protein